MRAPRADLGRAAGVRKSVDRHRTAMPKRRADAASRQERGRRMRAELEAWAPWLAENPIWVVFNVADGSATTYAAWTEGAQAFRFCQDWRGRDSNPSVTL